MKEFFYLILFFMGYILTGFIDDKTDKMFLKISKKNKYRVLLECLGGFLAVLCFYTFYFYQAIVVFSIFIILFTIALVDIKTMTIYLSTIIVFLIFVLLYRLMIDFCVIDMIYGAMSVSMFMLLMNFIIPESFGFGDIELMFVSGILLGWKSNLVAIVIAIINAGMYAFYLIVFKKVDRKSHFAFGPFLVCGIIISLFFGSDLFLWYLM